MRTHRVPLCEICGRPLGEAGVPWQRPDPRFPSGIVKKVSWIHRGCVPPTDDEDQAA